MMTDTPESVTLVPIDRIEVPNFRDRNMKALEEIIKNIRSVGLKKPITVTERKGADGAPAYLLARNYTIDDIITRTGLSEKYVRDIVFLLEKGKRAPDRGGAK